MPSENNQMNTAKEPRRGENPRTPLRATPPTASAREGLRPPRGATAARGRAKHTSSTHWIGRSDSSGQPPCPQVNRRTAAPALWTPPRARGSAPTHQSPRPT
eukprot:4649829-Prymnesium_polylepis.2